MVRIVKNLAIFRAMNVPNKRWDFPLKLLRYLYFEHYSIICAILGQETRLKIRSVL